MVWRQLPKLVPAGSIPVSCSNRAECAQSDRLLQTVAFSFPLCRFCGSLKTTILGANMEEIIDLYDIDRNKTGETHRRGDPMPKGRFCLTVHVCLFNEKGELLIQKRAHEQCAWPDLWDVSAGGGALCGECSRTAAEREAAEEPGIQISLSQERPRFTCNYPEGFDDFYFLHIPRFDTARLPLQRAEVSDARWASEEEILRLWSEQKFIPYRRGFLSFLFAQKDGCGTICIP